MDVTNRGLTTPQGHLELRRAWTTHYDIVRVGACWLAGTLNLQDVESVYELEVGEIVEALFVVRRLDAVSCPVFYQN